MPTKWPENFSGQNTSSYSIHLTWEPIEQPYRHGVILGYVITYNSTMDTVAMTIRYLGNSNISAELKGLHNYTDYDIKIAGFNSKGDGASITIVVRTDESGIAKYYIYF